MNTFFLVIYLTFNQPGGIIEYVDVPLEIDGVHHYSEAARICESELIKVKNELLSMSAREYLSGTCRRITKEHYNLMIEENVER